MSEAFLDGFNNETRRGITMLSPADAKVIYAKQLKRKCPVKTCKAKPGHLCNSNSVWVHAQRFKPNENQEQ